MTNNEERAMFDEAIALVRRDGQRLANEWARWEPRPMPADWRPDAELEQRV